MFAMTKTSIIIFFILYVTLYVFFYSYYFQRRSHVRKKREKAFKLLSDCFNDDVEIDESDIKLIYRKRARTIYPSYAAFIEGYLLYLRDGHKSVLNDFSKVNPILKEIITREQVARPYDGINESERRIMLSIEEAVQDESLKGIVRSNLEDLSDSIRKTEIDLRRTKKINRWTWPLTLMSFAFAVFTFFWGTRLSKKDYQEIKDCVSSALEESHQAPVQNDSESIIGIQDVGENQ